MTRERPDPIATFEREVAARVDANGQDEQLRAVSQQWLAQADAARYEYNFSWMGRPVIQYPQDVMALQELIWRTRPRTIVETGIAHGGMTLFFSSMLSLLGEGGRVVAVDVDIRAHNRAALEAHPLFDRDRISLIEGDSVAAQIVTQVHALADQDGAVLLCLDSNHTHAHVLAELEAYSSLVGPGQYIVVFDTSIETLEGDGYPDRPWGKGDNPMTAAAAFLARSSRFELDRSITDKLMITSAPGGFLRCVEAP